MTHKADRDRLHHASIVTPKQLRRMAQGIKETQPSEMLTIAERDRRAGMIRRAIEDLQERRRIERLTGDVW